MTEENGTEKQETKSEKFSRLASLRASRAIDSMAQLRKLANPDLYEFTPEQVNSVLTALQDSINAVHQAFVGAAENGGKKKKTVQLSFRI